MQDQRFGITANGALDFDQAAILDRGSGDERGAGGGGAGVLVHRLTKSL